LTVFKKHIGKLRNHEGKILLTCEFRKCNYHVGFSITLKNRYYPVGLYIFSVGYEDYTHENFLDVKALARKKCTRTIALGKEKKTTKILSCLGQKALQPVLHQSSLQVWPSPSPSISYPQTLVGASAG
jgi:hypothetical protein